VRSVPAMFLVDAQGSIVAQWSGEVDLDQVTERVEALLPPAEAR
jgi:glutathione peroxidase-family protein